MSLQKITTATQFTKKYHSISLNFFPGCRRDTNCPFGQVCQIDSSSNTRGKCEPGCHFNNDCTMGTACINGNCTDPCIGFNECGANAICETVSHSATCKCPEGKIVFQ